VGFPKKALNAWRFPSRSEDRRFHRPALAPAPVPSGAGSGPKTVPYRPAVPRPSRRPGSQAALALPEGLANSSTPGRQTGLPILRPRSFNGLGFGLPESFPLLIPPPRGFRHRVDPVPKSLLRRRPFGLCLGRANPRLDVWKVRLATDSGKRGTVQLSTFRGFASGQRWITQRLVAKRRDYPRSRCPSSRRRSALSLMNPAASCWS
jgi:hypothetical protein